MRPLGTADLFALAFLVAAHFMISKLAVDYRGHWANSFTMLTPIVLTGLLHFRLRLTWPVATAIHYPLGLAWSFLQGVTFSLYWNLVPHDFFERDTLGLVDPLRYGLLCTQVWAIFGILSTTAYGVGALLLAKRSSSRIGYTGAIDEP